MARHFALTIHLHDQRYHGAGEWPPAPARVFQALVAGAAQGRHLPKGAVRALKVLERLAPPIIAAPMARRGQRVSMFVPNNDLDAIDGNPDRVGEVRTKKAVQPYLLEGASSFLYAWWLPEEAGEPFTSLADGLYQFGRGVDPAWATGETLDDEQLATRLREHRGTIHRPTSGDGSSELAVPTTNSFESIVRRFDATLVRLRPGADGKTQFVQPPKAHFSMARYDGTPTLRLFELRSEREPAKSSPWTARRAVSLVERIRDTAVAALKHVLPERGSDIERVLVGRKHDGADAGPIEERVRFIPIPSIGHAHADQAIRRVLVQVPPGPLAEGDILWALKGRSLFDPQTGEVEDTTLAEAAVDEMVERYRATARTWRSVTPLALGSAVRRRIEPTRQREEAKSATERGTEERTAQRAVAQALRHAGIEASLVHVEFQREPFDTHGTRAERFAEGTRFAKETLWHVEIEFDREIRGPLVLGDGRFLGLGVLAPKIERGVFAICVEGGFRDGTNVTLLARSLRRAVMVRVQAVIGQGELPSYFHGHERDGTPLRTRRSTHLAFAVDAARSRLLIVPPHVLDRRRAFQKEAPHLELLERALEDIAELRAGSEGVLALRSASFGPDDVLSRSSRSFRSVTQYVVTRHAKRSFADEVVVDDVRRECERCKLPNPNEVRVTGVRGVTNLGLVANVEIIFAVAVRGPILLGRTRYLGGGLFHPIQQQS
jgi:CRISPR-associated protein Csb2